METEIRRQVRSETGKMGEAWQGSASNIRVMTFREIVDEGESSVCKRCRRKCRDMVPEESGTGNIVTGGSRGKWGCVGCPGWRGS